MRDRRVRARTAVPAVLAVAAVILAGCSDGEPDQPRPSRGTTSSTSGPRPSPTAAVEGGVLGAKFDWGRLGRTSDYLTDLGGGSTFYELVWCDLEGSGGSRAWTTPDRIAQRAQSIGLNLMLKIRTGTCELTDGDAEFTRGSKNKTESTMPKDMDAYRAFVTEAVERYAGEGVGVWAIENEINSQSFWGGTSQEYRELATAAAEAVRAADPDAVVVDNGLSSTTYGYGIAARLLGEGRDDEAVAAYNRYYERRFGTRGEQIVEVSSADQLQDALDSEQGRRNLEYLQLISDMAGEGIVDIRQIHFYEDDSAVPDLFDYLRATTPEGMPIEAWEVGSFVRGSEVSEPERVEDLVRKVGLLLGEGASKVLWLPLIPNPDGRNSDEPRVGLIDPDGTVRDSGKAFAQMAADAADAKATLVDRGGVIGVALEREGTTTAYVWSDGASVALKGAPEAATVEGTTTTDVGETPVRIQTDGELEEVLP